MHAVVIRNILFRAAERTGIRFTFVTNEPNYYPSIRERNTYEDVEKPILIEVKNSAGIRPILKSVL